MQQTAYVLIISSLFTRPVSQVSSVAVAVNGTAALQNELEAELCSVYLSCRSSWEAQLAVLPLDCSAICWAAPRVHEPLGLCMASCTKARHRRSFHSEHPRRTTSTVICNLQQVILVKLRASVFIFVLRWFRLVKPVRFESLYETISSGLSLLGSKILFLPARVIHVRKSIGNQVYSHYICSKTLVCQFLVRFC